MEAPHRRRPTSFPTTLPLFFLILLFLLTSLIDKASGVRCYVCSWSATYCQDFNCYNNPDVCTNNNFSPTIVRSVECPAGCESFVVTDPNGLVQQWRRNCDSTGETVGQWYDPWWQPKKCHTQYQLGLRITRCSCSEHLCNSSRVKFISPISILSSMFIFIWAVHFRRIL